MTNSAKMSNYYYTDKSISIIYSGLEDCIESAIAGRYIRKRKPWDK